MKYNAHAITLSTDDGQELVDVPQHTNGWVVTFWRDGSRLHDTHATFVAAAAHARRVREDSSCLFIGMRAFDKATGEWVNGKFDHASQKVRLEVNVKCAHCGWPMSKGGPAWITPDHDVLCATCDAERAEG